jgi:hypothetical protein
MVKNESSLSLQNDGLAGAGGNLQNIKSNVKNAYIKKINSLLNVSGDEEKDKLATISLLSAIRLKFISRNFDNQPSSLSDMENGSNQKALDQEEIKMQKNRESARNSRQRTKLYIGLLEKKVEDLNS